MFQRSTIQSAIALATGFLVMAIALTPVIAVLGLAKDLSAVSQSLLLVIGSLVAATAGGYLTALLAPANAYSHALGLMEVTLVLGCLSAIFLPLALPWPLQLISLATLLCGIASGAWQRKRQISGRI